MTNVIKFQPIDNTISLSAKGLFQLDRSLEVTKIATGYEPATQKVKLTENHRVPADDYN